ncbi:hypothetical protein FACS1894211_02610 [Clostridia bacterium]|nr:hypothetical protein FACS1894211_02610 [Clostridia bacterium]
MQIRYTHRAENDYNDIFEYIAKDNLEIAVKFTELIKKAVNNLSFFPNLGKKGTTQNDKYIIHKNYKITYEIKNDIIYIKHIKHGAQDQS